MQCERIRTPNPMEYEPMTTQIQATFVRRGELCKRLGVSKLMLNNWRKKGRLQEGAHYVWVSKTDILYNLELIQHFIHWGHQPITHMAAVARYLESLPHSQLGLTVHPDSQAADMPCSPD
jgi:hypothetical protein